MTPFLAEFLGTAVLILLGNGVVANCVLAGTKAGPQPGWIVITAGWALAVFVGVTLSAPASGAHLNPAVSLGLALSGKFPWADLPAYLLAQFLGAALGASMVWLIYRDHFEATEDSNAKLACFATGPAIRKPLNNFLSEALGTFVLVLTVLLFENPELSAGNLENAKIGLGSLGNLPVAFLVWSIGLSLGGTTGYAINPARDLAPRLMHMLLPIAGKRDSDWAYAWIPVAGPLAGGLIAGALFLALGQA
jgi:glycerol uptake facilitator protein